MDSLLFLFFPGAWFKRFYPALSFFLVLLSALSPASGQVRLLHQIDGTSANQALGFSVDGVGDLNGDGKSDFIIASLGTLSALVYSGADGALLYQIADTVLEVAGAGDVNGDGIPDFMIGAPDESPGGIIEAGSAYVYSGADGALLYRKNGTGLQQTFGTAVAGAGDVNGDGNADFIVGSPPGSSPYGAFVYSGVDGSVLYQISRTDINDQMGSVVAGAGDVNGDGKDDFIVGARSAFPGGVPYAGSAFVYSGADGMLLYQMDGDTNDGLGWSVAGTGDVNGDGKADFIIGAAGASPNGISSAGSAYVYSGADGSLLYQKNGAAKDDILGSAVDGAGDVNGDGRPDFVISAVGADANGYPYAGSVFVYSGATGALLYRIDGDSIYPALARTVAGAGDVDGDGSADIIIGNPYAEPGGMYRAGAAFVYAGIATGDLNGDGILNFEDAVILINCAFLGIGSCQPGVADLNCDGALTPLDVVLELNLIFLGQTPPHPC